ncbi:MAG: hypothetical protein ABIA47_01535 [bacterium]
MKKVREQLEEDIAQMLFDAVKTHWEPPFFKEAFTEEMHGLLVSVEEKLKERMENDDTFVNAK